MTRNKNLFFVPRMRSRRVLLIAIAACCVFGVIAYAAIPDSGGVIHGCYKRNSGTLRVIDDAVNQCDNSEAPIQWSQTGPQGIQGLQGPQGPPGPAPLVTAASGYSPMLEPIGCSLPIRSKQFVKQSNTSFLRITYTDNLYVRLDGLNGQAPAYNVSVNIDGGGVFPAGLYTHVVGEPGNEAAPAQFTIVANATQVPAGTHTLSSFFTSFLGDFPSCNRGFGYAIEIEEVEPTS